MKHGRLAGYYNILVIATQRTYIRLQFNKKTYGTIGSS